jgi:hypothetical protein
MRILQFYNSEKKLIFLFYSSNINKNWKNNINACFFNFYQWKKRHFDIHHLSRNGNQFLYIPERSKYGQDCSIYKHSARYVSINCLTFRSHSLNNSISQPYYKDNEIKEVIPKQTRRSNEKPCKCAGFFGRQNHEIQPARDGERISKIILRVILGEPIVTMEDQYNLFRVTSFVTSSSGVWLALPRSLRRAKGSLNKITHFMLLCIKFYLTQRNLFEVTCYVDPYLISVRISVRIVSNINSIKGKGTNRLWGFKSCIFRVFSVNVMFIHHQHTLIGLMNISTSLYNTFSNTTGF